MTAIADATDRSTVKKLIQTVEELQQTVKEQNERIDALEDELADHQDHDGREHASIHQRITETEDAVETLKDHTLETDPTETAPADVTDSETRTPLERIVALPEQVADRELTANQERARFIAGDVHDYAEKAPAGLVIDSRAIKRVEFTVRITVNTVGNYLGCVFVRLLADCQPSPVGATRHLRRDALRGRSIHSVRTVLGDHYGLVGCRHQRRQALVHLAIGYGLLTGGGPIDRAESPADTTP